MAVAVATALVKMLLWALPACSSLVHSLGRCFLPLIWRLFTYCLQRCTSLILYVITNNGVADAEEVIVTDDGSSELEWEAVCEECFTRTVLPDDPHFPFCNWCWENAGFSSGGEDDELH